MKIRQVLYSLYFLPLSENKPLIFGWLQCWYQCCESCLSYIRDLIVLLWIEYRQMTVDMIHQQLICIFLRCMHIFQNKVFKNSNLHLYTSQVSDNLFSLYSLYSSSASLYPTMTLSSTVFQILWYFVSRGVTYRSSGFPDNFPRHLQT